MPSEAEAVSVGIPLQRISGTRFKGVDKSTREVEPLLPDQRYVTRKYKLGRVANVPPR
jgi:hypothetical protein